MRRVVLVVALILCVTLVSAKQPSESHSATKPSTVPAAIEPARPSIKQLANEQQTMPHNSQLAPNKTSEHDFESADNDLSGQLNLSK